MTYTEQALQIVDRLLSVAARDGGQASSRGISFSAKGYIFFGGNRIGRDAAIQTLAHMLEQEALSMMPKTFSTTKSLSWDKLNQNTKDFFLRFCEAMQAQTGDADMLVAARVGGRHGITMKLTECPLLTNCKKAGLLASSIGDVKSHKMVVLTDAGRAIWQSLV